MWQSQICFPYEPLYDFEIVNQIGSNRTTKGICQHDHNRKGTTFRTNNKRQQYSTDISPYDMWFWCQIIGGLDWTNCNCAMNCCLTNLDAKYPPWAALSKMVLLVKNVRQTAHIDGAVVIICNNTKFTVKSHLQIDFSNKLFSFPRFALS